MLFGHSLYLPPTAERRARRAGSICSRFKNSTFGAVGGRNASSARPPQTLAPPVSWPRLRRLIGHPAMAGAIGAAWRRLEAAIGEILAQRIAERPSAVDVADVREPDPLHLADLRPGENPSRLSRFTRESRTRAGLLERGMAAGRGRSAPPRVLRGAEPP